MEAIQIVSGTAVPLRRSDVDTDQIIPSDWLKRVERTGFEQGLFSEWRDDRNFVLNDERYSEAVVLIGGPNFGTGSSREHAVWAIQQYGFQAVISPKFADIFRNNCLNIGVLPVKVSPEFLDKIFKAVYDDPKIEVTVNLPDQKVLIPKLNLSESFDINSYKKENMLNGYDDIDYLMNIKDNIIQFSKNTPL